MKKSITAEELDRKFDLDASPIYRISAGGTSVGPYGPAFPQRPVFVLVDEDATISGEHRMKLNARTASSRVDPV